MGKREEYFAQAEDCKRWSAKATTTDAKARWLDLAGKWMRLAEECPASEVESFKPASLTAVRLIRDQDDNS